MRAPAAVSAVVHLAMFAFAWFGLPEFRKPPAMLDTPIPIEIVTIADKTNPPPPAPPPAPPKVEPPKPVAAAPPPPPPPPPESAPEPAAVLAPPPKPEPKPEPQVAQPPEPKPAPKPEPKPEPQVAAVTPPRPVAKPERKPVATPPVPPKPEPKPEPQADFDTVLRSLDKIRQQPTPPTPSQIARPGPPVQSLPDQPLTISEIDLIRRQIADCWNLQPGARDARNMVVTLRMRLNRDGTVEEATIIDSSGRLNSDPFYRIAAEAAQRAVLNPRCNPLRLPPEKYDTWKSMTLNFDPRQMFGT
jgi:hypothetical protein